jgi:phage tail-like protein
MSEVFFPPVAFHFDVQVLGGSSPTPEIDASFQEVSGMDRELELEPLNEGGENGFTYQLPKRGKHPNLVLKRGVVSGGSDLATWAGDTIGSYFAAPIEPRTLVVHLLNHARDPLISWTFYNAYPVKWVTSPLNSTESKILVETLEMAYTTVKREVFDLPTPKFLLPAPESPE